jgi:hypothetical protein
MSCSVKGRRRWLFRLAFDTRAKKLLDVVDKRPDRDSEAQIFRLDFCAALRHHAANPREWGLLESGEETLGVAWG